MKLLLILLLAACAMGHDIYTENGKLSHLDTSCSADHQHRIDSLLAGHQKRLDKFDSLLMSAMAPNAIDSGGHKRIDFKPVLDKAAQQAWGFGCPPHDWCWDDTSYFETHFAWPKRKVFTSHGICRDCLSDTTAKWTVDEDEKRKASAKKLAEYETLKAKQK